MSLSFFLFRPLGCQSPPYRGNSRQEHQQAGSPSVDMGPLDLCKGQFRRAVSRIQAMKTDLELSNCIDVSSHNGTPILRETGREYKEFTCSSLTTFRGALVFIGGNKLEDRFSEHDRTGREPPST